MPLRDALGVPLSLLEELWVTLAAALFDVCEVLLLEAHGLGLVLGLC